MLIFLYLLSMFGLTFLIKESDGPWGIMAWVRNKLMTNKYVGVFFFKLLECYFCVGFWAGIAVYLLSPRPWEVNILICFGLAGGATSLILNGVLMKLSHD